MTLSWIVRQAALAPELRPADVRVLVAASELLDYVAYRSLKPAGLGLTIGMSGSRVATALERLAQHGFLDREVSRDPTTPARYRLPGSRLPPSARGIGVSGRV